MADVRRCPAGHPAGELETTCALCGVALEPLPPRDEQRTGGGERSQDVDADGATPTWSAATGLPEPAGRGGSGWPHIGLGMLMVTVAGLALAFTVPLDFPVLTVLLSILALLGSVNLTIGAVAEGIRVASRAR